MSDLVELMKVALADTYAFGLKAQNYHWNVTGPNFSDYHAFFGEFYTTVWGSVDLYAEHARTLDTFVPGSLSRFSELTRIQDETSIPSAQQMFSRLYADNEIMINQLNIAHNLANSLNKRGIVNFLEGQIDYHEKMHWMLKSFTNS